MKKLLFPLTVAVIILLDLFFLYKIEIKGVRPDFLFTLIFFMGFNAPLEKSIFPAWLIGIIKDLASQNEMGTTALVYLISIIVISLLKEIVFKDDTGIQIVVLFLSAWICHFLNGLGLLLFYGAPPLGYVIIKAGAISLYTVLAGGIILIAVYKIQWNLRWRATQS